MRFLRCWRHVLRIVFWPYWLAENPTMADRFTRAKRSEIMSSIKGRNTSPERIMRRCLRKLDIRFRGNVTGLTGTPDFVLPNLHIVLFVHGCFWHGHRKCRRASIPATNRAFWARKIKGNKARDRKINKTLREQGWAVLTFWQCRMKKEADLLKRLSVLKQRG